MRTIDSLKYHGNGKLRIEADQCTLGNRCHNTLDMGLNNQQWRPFLYSRMVQTIRLSLLHGHS